MATRLIATVCLSSLIACGGGRSKSAMYAPSPAAEMSAAGPGGGGNKIANEPGETWKRSTIVANSSRVMVGDREQLTLRSMQTNVAVDGYRARVVIDYLYANDHDSQYEGTFQLRLPEEASPFFFAFGETEYAARDAQVAKLTIATDGEVREPRQIMAQRATAWQHPKEARMVPRETAQIAYDQTVRRRVDPAIMEWAGAGVFSARVFPLAARKLHRIVIGYDVDLVRIGNDLEYRFDLPADVPASIVDVSLPDGTVAQSTPRVDGRSASGRQWLHFEGTKDRTIAVRTTPRGAPLLVGTDPAGTFFAGQAAPVLPATKGATSDTGVFLVDTSLSSNPDRFNIWLKLMRGVLDGNRDTMSKFNVLFFSVDAHAFKAAPVANTPQNVDELMTFANTLALEGATDLGAAFGAVSALSLSNADLFLLSDGAATWGESNLHALGRTLRATRSSLFAYQTGLAGTDLAALSHLARESGGAVFSVTGESEIAKATTAHRARPWQLMEARIAGGSDLMIAGRPTSLFPGQTLTFVGRGALAPGAQLELVVNQNGNQQTIHTKLAEPIATPLATRAYGQVATARLEELEDASGSIAKAYATHFRVTGRSSSLLMLDSEADYQRFNIKPDDDAYVVKSVAAAAEFDSQMKKLFDTLGSPKEAFLAHLAKLEKHPSARLQPAASYRALLSQLPVEAFAVPTVPLRTTLRDKRQMPAPVLAMLAKHELDYDAMSADADARRARATPQDALKSLSSLVEQNPGDAVLARDVGFSAMDLGLRAQAYHLFRRVAEARPHEPQTYRAMAQALAAMGKHELAIAYYEIPLAGTWEPRFGDLRTIVVLDYVRFLRGVIAKPGADNVRGYAQSRLATLSQEVKMDRADVVVSITWNTDATDVDLHVIEPSGEECFYQHRRTRSGGELTQDVTQGYGPEMYVLRKAPVGNYNVFAHYFASDRNRASARTKVYVTMFENWGMPDERVTERVIALETGKQKHAIAQLARRAATIAK
ncbi:MAG: DUF2135 domain-containing protein [Deltaproteobacteria bacterium]|nr:DUF2135 domain-containing protein [Deltaproteobacteria bacterium]